MSHSSFRLTGAIALFAFWQCPLEEWGSHPGQVCDGAESNLRPIAGAADLSGWWVSYPLEAPNEEHVVDRYVGRFVFIDAGQHPRAWTVATPDEYEKYGQPYNQSFGCEDYTDHPMVLNQVNISPDSERRSFREGCSSGTSPDIDHVGRRALVEQIDSPGQRCLVYQTWSPSSFSPDGFNETEVICFRYLEQEDELEIQLTESPSESFTRRYRRYIPGSSTQPSEGSSSGMDTSTQQESLSS